jgi:hypothetical protein
MDPRRIARVACLSLLFGFILCVCAAAAAPSLSEVEGFDAYRVYYAGEETAGLPLEDISEVRSDKDERSIRWTFFYGDCTPPEGEGGCAPPLEIQNWSTCHRWFSAHFRKRGLYDFRGAKATGGGGRYEVSPMEIFTGRTTVVIFGDGKSVIKSAARQLRNIRQTGEQSLLPRPVPGSLRGNLPCQHKPG